MPPAFYCLLTLFTGAPLVCVCPCFLTFFFFYEVLILVSIFCFTLFIYLFLVYNILNSLLFHQKTRNLIDTIFKIVTRRFLNLRPFLSEHVPFSLFSVFFFVALALKMFTSLCSNSRCWPLISKFRLFNIHYFVFCGI